MMNSNSCLRSQEKMRERGLFCNNFEKCRIDNLEETFTRLHNKLKAGSVHITHQKLVANLIIQNQEVDSDRSRNVNVFIDMIYVKKYDFHITNL